MKYGAIIVVMSMLAGCQTFQVMPVRDTSTITRVIATPAQTLKFCELVGLPGRRTCAVWAGDKGVVFTPNAVVLAAQRLQGTVTHFVEGEE